jgi:hypothetical protein
MLLASKNSKPLLIGAITAASRMRFCSSACMVDYQLRLAEETKEKIRRLDLAGRNDLQKNPVLASSKTSSKICGNLQRKPLEPLQPLAARRA